MKVKYKTIKGLSTYIAKAAYMDEAFANGNFDLAEIFDKASEAAIKSYAAKIEQVLLASDGLRMSAYPLKEAGVLDLIKAICPNLHCGFAMQEQIILTCAARGIKIYVSPRAAN